MREKIIVYALGERWKKNWEKIHAQYDILACSDTKTEASIYAFEFEFISPKNIKGYVFDKIILCTNFVGVREDLVIKYKLPAEKIFYYDELFGKLRAKALIQCKNNNSILTIIIPTYNREKRLKRTLDILESQTDKNYKIIILDNCSDYNINKVLNDRSEEFVKKVSIVCNKNNIGMCGNLSNLFLQEQQGWIWTLSDDDIPSINSVEIIRSEIDDKNDTGVISFSIREMSDYMDGKYNLEFQNLSELFGFYRNIFKQNKDGHLWQGDFIYISNKVYNMRYVNKYVEKIFTYSYTGVPQLVPVLFILKNQEAKVRISDLKIVAYESPEGDHWNILDTALGTSTITDFFWNLSKKERITLYRMIMFDYKTVIKSAGFSNNKTDLNKLIKLYIVIYRYFLPVSDKFKFWWHVLKRISK